MAKDERTELFGFGVKVEGEEWTVDLPHQCDEWEITGDWPRQPQTRERAIHHLENFIREAQETLAKLREAS